MQLPFTARMTRRRRIPNPVGPLSLINMNVDASALLALRQLVLRVCSERDALQFIRVDACHETLRARVCVCVAHEAQADVIAAVQCQFADAVITRLSGTSLPHVPRLPQHALQ